MDGEADGTGEGGGERDQGVRIYRHDLLFRTQRGLGWPSSPLGNPHGGQEHTNDDHFFSTDTIRGAGTHLVPTASFTIASKPPMHTSGASGFASAADLTDASPSVRRLASTAKLPPPSLPYAEETGVEPVSVALFSSSKLSGFGRPSALPVLAADERPPSPPPQQDYDSWFDTDTSSLPVDAFTFKTAKVVLRTSEDVSESPGKITLLGSFRPCLSKWQAASQTGKAEDLEPEITVSNPPVGFMSAAHQHLGKSNWAAPSAEALARAAAKMKEWQVDFDHDEETTGTQNAENAAPAGSRLPTPPSLQTSFRPVLCAVENAFSPARPPDTPTPAGAAAKDHFTLVAGMQIKNKPFKSPLVTRPQGQLRSVSAPTQYTGLPLNPAQSTGFRVASGTKLPAAFSGNIAAEVTSTPARPAPGTSAFVSPVKASASSLASPVKALGMTPRRLGVSNAPGKGRFSTPFKAGLAPGESGRSQLAQNLKEEQACVANAVPMQIQAAMTPFKKGKERREHRFFDSNPITGRRTLASSGLQPLSYNEDELEDMGINVEELRQMRPINAVYYRFHSVLATIGIEESADSEQLGPKAAFVHLKEHGCDLATQQWVTNHYGLILWKLAGLVCLEPQREQDAKTKRWCWPEVIRQLLYRYERELLGGARPALRLVSTEDAPVACPMILCVSNIVVRGSPVKANQHGIPLDPHPELEVTDGWYRLRATVDMPLARAIRRGRVCIGTKLAVSGAKLSGDRKEPCEILEAYDNTTLELTGNATNLAPWHAKLGFVKHPFIATSDKLTADGGSVPAMDVVIDKVYPIAFLEFERNEDGSTSRVGPRDEKEEMRAHDAWLAKQEAAAIKIKERLHADVQRLLKLSERLYARAGPQFDSSLQRGDPMPDHIEYLYEEMMEDYLRPSQSWDRLDAFTSGWLHHYCKQQADLAAARMEDELEKELRNACPPRNVRDFRVVIAKDARWRKKEPMRTIQITLWDPLKVVFSENGNPGEIKEGQRFLVTNLMPNQANSWMAPGPGAEVYLVSKRTSRWTNITSARC
ncbi:hypothetical protein BC628DRAFT_1408952 [Trametes gibbosa]|nr:hypothetical protein BC628DRAFT_1408952 [Trametes gibbosa]